MNTLIHKNHKSCGSCGYWTGTRTIDPSYSYALTEGNSSGTCAHQKGSGRAIRKAMSSGCSDLYTIWSTLK